MSVPPPFGAGPDAGLTPDRTLQTELESRIDASRNKAQIRAAGIGLVDLTAISENPSKGPFAFPFATLNTDREVPVYSLSKIAAMFGAFHLRNRVIVAAAAIGGSAKDSNDLIAQIETAWKPLVSRKIGLTPFDFPNLKDIFQFGLAAPWLPVNFSGSNSDPKKLDAYHHGKGGGKIANLGFMDRMKLMIRWSDNDAARSCVHAVSFQYMNSALAADGFADNKRNGILWLGGDFGSGPIMGQPPWDRSGTWVRANVRGIASFMALLWTNQLVSADCSRIMRDEIMRERGFGYATWLSNSTPSKARAWSKVGANGTQSEAAIIEGTPSGKQIRYIGVVLNTTISLVQEVAPMFEDTVAAVH